MGTRVRTKTAGLVSHTTPVASYMSEESILKKKFNKGTITKEELKKLAAFIAIKKKEKPVTKAKIFGIWTPIAKLNLSVEFLKSENFELR